MPKYGKYAQQNGSSPPLEDTRVEPPTTGGTSNAPISNPVSAVANKIIIRKRRDARLKKVRDYIESTVSILLCVSVFVASISLTGMFIVSWRTHNLVEDTYKLDMSTSKSLNEIIKKLQGELDTMSKKNPPQKDK